MKRLVFLMSVFIAVSFISKAQEPQEFLTAGPMLGYVEHRSALIWCEVSQEVKHATIRYWENTNADFYYEIDYRGSLGNPYNPIKFELPKLKMDMTYNYEIILNNKTAVFPYPLSFHTKKLWEHRTEAPDFSFLTGSCNYLNDMPYDRPVQPPYGQDPIILKTMANTPSDFMLWLGDNLYYRESDYSSVAGMNYRYSYNRAYPQMQPLLTSRPNYATWDDHDYGPNDANSTFELKEASLNLFKNYWGNKSYGESDNPGTYGKFQWSDCDFFLTDDRYHRSSDKWNDSINGKPNCNKKFFGDKQLLWLKSNLLSSRGVFKFIVCGNQVLNPASRYECFYNYSCEYNDLINFISEYKITGVVFLSGDRHISEVIKVQPKKCYPLYDITNSPLTSGVFDKIKDTPEFNNPSRIPNTLITENNFTRIAVTGKNKERVLKLQFINKAGEVLTDFSINASDLVFK